MNAEYRSLSKVQSNDSIWSRDSEEESVPKEPQDVNKSLENILLDFPEVSSTSSGEKSSKYMQLLEKPSDRNRNNSSTSHKGTDEIENSAIQKELNTSNININFETKKSLNIVSESLEIDDKVTAVETSFDENNKRDMEYIEGSDQSLPSGTIICQTDTEDTGVSNTKPPEEVVNVNFIEDRGEMPNSISSKNLLKFFHDSPTSKLTIKNIDEDGKNFFDSFTVSQKENEILILDKKESNINIKDLSQKIVTNLSQPQTTNLPLFSDLLKLNEKTNEVLQTHLSSDQPILQTVIQQPSFIPQKEHSNTKNSNTNAVLNTPFIPSTLSSSQKLPARCYDAWIPPQGTSNILSNLPANLHIPLDQRSLPGILVEHSLGDPVMELMMKHLSLSDCSVRKVFSCNDVPRNINGLLSLMHEGHLRSAVDLTGRLISDCGQGADKLNHSSTNSPYSLQLWFCRLALFQRLGLHSTCHAEWHAFQDLDTPDLYYQFHQSTQPTRTGSMVPFGMRLLQAEHQRHMGLPEVCLTQLYKILGVVKQIQTNIRSGLLEDGSGEREDSMEEEASVMWHERHTRILYCLANCLHQMKDYHNSLRVYRRLLRKDPLNTCLLHSLIGRLLLQAGDIERAEREFLMVSKLNKTSLQPQVLMNRALLEMARGRYSEAHALLKKLLEEDKNNITALNNMCVCVLYTGRLKEALRNLEVIIYTNPLLYLQEIVILNLCTLYELESSKAAVKKKNLLMLVAQHKNNAFNPSCLKLA